MDYTMFGIMASVVAVVGLFLKFFGDYFKSKKTETDAINNLQKQIDELKAHQERRQDNVYTAINDLKNSTERRQEQIYESINQVKEMFTQMRIELPEKYVQKTDCLVKHSNP